MTPEAAYQNLLEFQRETAYLASLGALAAWDQRTKKNKKGQISCLPPLLTSNSQ